MPSDIPRHHIPIPKPTPSAEPIPARLPDPIAVATVFSTFGPGDRMFSARIVQTVRNWVRGRVNGAISGGGDQAGGCVAFMLGRSAKPSYQVVSASRPRRQLRSPWRKSI